jgi:hypothetical protein
VREDEVAMHGEVPGDADERRDHRARYLELEAEAIMKDVLASRVEDEREARHERVAERLMAGGLGSCAEDPLATEDEVRDATERSADDGAEDCRRMPEL